MRVHFLLTLLAAISLAAQGAGARSVDLKALYDAHDWFALRDAVTPDSPPLYRGAVAYAFNDGSEARTSLEQALTAAPGSDQAIEARGLLIYLNQREGRYAQALEQVRLLRQTLPDAPGLKNADALFGALSRFPEQSVAVRGAARVRYTLHGGNLFVPVRVNTRGADYMIDTGANFSVVSESEAKRLGLAVADTGATGTVITGAQVGFRTALVSTLQIGMVRLRNVVVLVSPDSNRPFVGLPAGKRGVLGIPVLLALETVRWTRTREIDLGLPSAPADVPRASLCFEGVSPVAKASFDRRDISLVLDTGATRTNLSPLFARDFPDALRGGTKRSRVIGGVGDRTIVDSIRVPEIGVELGGRRLLLRPAHVLLRQLAADDRWSYGRIGMDSLAQAPLVAIDFRAMTLRLEP